MVKMLRGKDLRTKPITSSKKSRPIYFCIVFSLSASKIFRTRTQI